MRTILDRLQKSSHWLLFIILEAASVVLLIRFESYHGSVWFTQANRAVAQVLEWEQDLLDYANLKQVNRDLSRRNLLLEHNLDVMRRKLFMLSHDSSYTELALRERIEGMRLIEARVINNSVMMRDNYLTLNRGALDGIRPEMGVLSGTGIVGVVAQTSDHYCIVQSLLHSKSSISCRLRGTNYFGYLKWTGSKPLQAVLDDVPRHARFKVGDIVETSGYSSMFPAGIFVGRVRKIRNSGDGLSYQLIVGLGTDLANVQDVTVLAQEYQEELDSLQSERNIN